MSKFVFNLNFLGCIILAWNHDTGLIFDRINMTKNRLEYDRKKFTPTTNMNVGT